MENSNELTGNISNNLEVLSTCESKILELLTITQETLQELQNIPACDNEILQKLSLSYLENVYYIQTNLKQISAIENKNVVSREIEDSDDSKTVDLVDNENIIMKKIDVLKALCVINEVDS